MTEAERHYKRMTETPVEKLIATLAIPTIISMLISNIYNLADTYFVGTLGVSASGAVGIVFTLMAILQAIGFMLGHGSGSIISRQLAQKDVETASRYVSTSFFLALGAGLIFVVLGIPFVRPLMRLLGSTETILPYAVEYGFFILASAPAMIASLVLNNVLRYEGKAFYAMIGLTTGGLLNMALDPLFIYVFHMGVAGAGLATALSQVVSFLVLLFMFRRHAQTKISIRSFAPDLRLIGDIVTTGFPSLFRQGLSSISSGILNNAAGVYGDACVSAMAITSRCQFFMLSIALGIGQGFQPVAGFNFQAHKYARLRRAFRFTLIAGLCVLVVFCSLGFAFSPFIVGLFQDDPEVLRIGGLALRFASFSLFFTPFNITPNMLFQSAGQKGRALLLACLRSGLCFIPLLLILPGAIGLLGVQLSQPCSDILSAVISFPFAIHFFRRLPKEDEHVAADD
ncbi:MAG: MATE family efflux transporter [Clostridia bacterium]|nr:MATE family efflux transporter [Clostridia bacterium]